MIAIALIPHGNEDKGVIIPPEMVQEIPPAEELPPDQPEELPDLFEGAFSPLDATVEEVREHVKGLGYIERVDWSASIRSIATKAFQKGIASQDNEKIREARAIYLRCKEIAPTENMKAEYDNLIRLCDAVIGGASKEEIQKMGEQMQQK